MLRNLKFPLLYIFEALLLVPLTGGFVLTVSFLAAKPISSFNLGGKSLPAGWSAAYINHGRYLRGYLVKDHPIAFAAVLILLLLTLTALYRVHKAQVAQRNAGVSSRSHKVAQACVLLVFAALGYTLLAHLFYGVSPS